MGKKSKMRSRSVPEQARGDTDTTNKARKEEERFDTSKPHFRKSKEESSKVVIDERFASVLTDERFQLQVKDKYGRKTKKNKKEELSAFYRIENDRSEKNAGKKKSESLDDKDDQSRTSSSSSRSTSSSSNKNGNSDEEDNEDPASRIAYLTALSRGQIDVSSSSESDEDGVDEMSQSSEEDDEDQDDDDSAFAALGSSAKGVLDPSNRTEEIELTEEPSRYLAVTDLDWEHLRAVDVFAILASFTPPGALRRVSVYMSDFGQERMKKEELMGPPQAVWKKPNKTKEKAEHLAVEKSGDELDLDKKDKSVRKSDDIINKVSDSGTLHEEDHLAENEEEEEDDDDILDEETFLPKEDQVESGFDPEKLRAYEASKLKYFFAVAEFANPEHADIAYKEVDGMEFEHSSAAVDLRAIPEDNVDDIIKDRPLRDEASHIPSNYDPPEFVVNALQQTKVQCTWEAGDRERERQLTKYTSGEAWKEFAEGEDVRAYVASDVSSVDEVDSDDEKAVKMRKMLGLDSDGEEEGLDKALVAKNDDATLASSSDEEDNNSDGEKGMEKEFRFVPGEQKSRLQDKIRSKLQAKDESQELTPWEKYKEKRKQKRREKRQAAKDKKKEINRARSRSKTQEKDKLFLHSDDSADDESDKGEIQIDGAREKELELLVTGDDGEDEARNYDMRELERMEKNKSKKLRGSRKRKEIERTATIPGADFKLDTADDRFKAVLDGVDDRFGIDRTDPNFKETAAMKQILSEQARRRKSKKQKKTETEPVQLVQDANADAAVEPSAGSTALSTLVASIKSKVNDKQ